MSQPKRKGGLRLDPSVVQFQQQAASNKAAQTPRQRYDAARTRVRADVPEWLRDELDAIAEELSTSRTQLGAFLWAWAATRYREGDADLEEILHTSMANSRSINVDVDLDLDWLVERHQNAVANSAEGPKCAK